MRRDPTRHGTGRRSRAVKVSTMSSWRPALLDDYLTGTALLKTARLGSLAAPRMHQARHFVSDFM